MKIIDPRAPRESLTYEAYFDRPRRETLKRNGLTESWFLDFGKPNIGYGVARNVKKSCRPDALREIEERMLKPIQNGQNPDHSTVQTLAVEFALRGFTNGKALSLLSKLCFILQPGDYPLYDSNARKAIKARGNPAPNGDYALYVKSFNAEYKRSRDAIVATCSTNSIKQHAENCGLPKTILEEEWFRRRVFDWQLWLEGGGSKSPELVVPS